MKKTAYFVLGSMAALAVLVVGAMVTHAATTDNSDTNNTNQNQQQEFRRGGMHGDMMQNREDMQAHRDEMNALMETADYDTWRAAVEAHAAEMGHEELPPILDEITADNFDQFKQMHELMQSGDRDGAQAIADELGLERPNQHQGMMKHPFGNREMRDNNGDGVCNMADLPTSDDMDTAPQS